MNKAYPDATFSRMKDDHMQNDQLKPSYNLQVLVDGGYIVGNYYNRSDRTDYATMIPAFDHIHKHIDWKYNKYCAERRYDYQQNHTALEKERF